MRDFLSEFPRHKADFIRIGAEFYMAGRLIYYTSFFKFPTLYPIFSHNAIEYFIKAYLMDHMKLKKLRNIGHNITKLWKIFKEKASITSTEYDSFIEQFDKSEKIRYPQECSASESITVGYPVSRKFKYEQADSKTALVSLQSIDGIIYLICNKIKAKKSIVNYIKFHFKGCWQLFINNSHFKRRSLPVCKNERKCTAIIASFDGTEILRCNVIRKKCPYLKKAHPNYPFESYRPPGVKTTMTAVVITSKNYNFTNSNIGKFIKKFPDGRKIYYIIPANIKIGSKQRSIIINKSGKVTKRFLTTLNLST